MNSVLGDAVQHEKALGTRLNIHKNKVLAVGGWNGTIKDLGVDFASNIRIRIITFSNTMERAAHISWS
jgi:hypothetical protein